MYINMTLVSYKNLELTTEGPLRQYLEFILEYPQEIITH